MVNGPTTPIPVKAKPSSTDPVIPPISMGESVKSHSNSGCAMSLRRDTHANPVSTSGCFLEVAVSQNAVDGCVVCTGYPPQFKCT